MLDVRPRRPRLMRFVICAMLAALFVFLAMQMSIKAVPGAQQTGPAEANTIINTHVTTDTMWTLAGSPYEVTTDIQVYPGATLSVEPGVVVEFAQQAMLDVRGKILATGTLTQPILFTGSTQTPGWWDGIHISGATGAPNTGSVLDYVTIEYGGYIYANLYFFSAEAKLDHAILRHSLKDGLYGLASTGVDASNTTFSNNGRYAVYIYEASGQSRFASLTATGNGINAIGLRTAIVRGERRFENAGLPYHIIEYYGVYPGGVLTIEPGVEVAFNTNVSFDMRGILHAVGTAADPILLTGIQKIRGAWNGLFIQGSSTAPNHGSLLDHVTLEYGGSIGANLRLQHATARVTNSTIRQSGGDGVLVDIGGTGTWVEESSIVDNSGFGLRNRSLEGFSVIAAGNWWGSVTGPSVAQNCNEGGTGSVVSPNVEFMPFLTEAHQQISPVAPLDLHQITISPQQWYVPADGVTQAEVILTLRNGEGNPIAGQPVYLHTTRGEALSGGLTNGHGEVRARVKSHVAGEATLTASVTRDLPCSSDYRSGTATINFTPFAQLPHMPGAQAPYMSGRLSLGQLPLVKDVPTFISAQMVNPGDAPIYVNGSFGIAQFGIGLQFPPVGNVQGVKIEPGETKLVGVEWTPSIIGHYCIIFTYTFTNQPGDVGSAEILAGGSAQRNADIQGSTPGSKQEKSILEKAKKAIKFVSKFFKFAGPVAKAEKKIVTSGINWQMDQAATISQNLGGDPPRQDYTVIEEVTLVFLPPVVAEAQRTAQMAAALTDLQEAFSWINAHGEAAVIAYDRYGGAAAAQDMRWASLQLQEMLDNKSKMAAYLLVAADALDAYRAAWLQAGLADMQDSPQQFKAWLEELATSGFTSEEIDEARAIGLSDEEIEGIRQTYLAMDATQGNRSYLTNIEAMALSLRELAGAILFPPTFGMRVGGSAGLLLAAGGVEPPPEAPITNNLARIFEVTKTLQIGNPKPITAIIDLRLLPVDLPAGWTTTVSPQQLTLGPAEQAEVTVRLTPQGPAVQGTIVRVAVEGRIGSELLGGVVVETLVPYDVAKPDAHLLTFLPAIAR